MVAVRLAGQVNCAMTNPSCLAPALPKRQLSCVPTVGNGSAVHASRIEKLPFGVHFVFDRQLSKCRRPDIWNGQPDRQRRPKS